MTTVTHRQIVTDLTRLGLRDGDLVLCHSSLSAIGRVDGGPRTVVAALVDVIGAMGTLVTPAFTGSIDVPFTADVPTTLGAIPAAVLDWPGRVRSEHPQVSVAAIGLHATVICARQPLGYALGVDSPFDEIIRRGGKILLIGVGHNRSSMLHHSESLIDNHRRKMRRFPIVENGVISWIETPDVGDDNDTHFPTVGAEFEERDPSVRSGFVGSADARLFDAASYDRYAQQRLAELIDDR